MVTTACTLGMALNDVLTTMEAEGSLTKKEVEALLDTMGDIFVKEMAKLSHEHNQRTLSNHRPKLDDGSLIQANVDEYRHYMDTWELKLRDVRVKHDGNLLNTTTSNMTASFQRIQRKKRQSKRKTVDV